MRGPGEVADKPKAPKRVGRYVAKGAYACDAPAWVHEMQDHIQKQSGERLNRLLAERDVTHREMAAILGLSPSALRHRVYGRTPLNLSEAVVAAYHLNVDVSELVGPVEDPKDQPE